MKKEQQKELLCLGVVGSPMGQEATSRQFYFWVRREILVEETQLVVCYSEVAGKQYTFQGVIDEVRRRSRKRNMDDEIDFADGDIDYIPPFESDGYTYARVSILAVSPSALTPPCERSKVYLASETDVAMAYGFDPEEMPNALSVGLVKNGGDQLAGPGKIDLDYLLGTNGGHMNVNGSAGRGTKSSFLLHCNWMLLEHVRSLQERYPSRLDIWQIVPIILNVKGYDLFHIDHWNRYYQSDTHRKHWQLLGIEDPHPFQQVRFFAPQQPENTLPIPTKRSGGVEAYSWSLSDIIEQGLFSYLFADADTSDANFIALAMDIEAHLTQDEKKGDGSIKRSLHSDRKVANFQELLNWVNAEGNKSETNRELPNHHTATWKKLYRRLLRLVYEGAGVLRRTELRGKPLSVVSAKTSNPVVVDLFALAKTAELQRFVVATILRQLIEARTGANAFDRLVYVVTLDELNRFAPKGARDPITQLIEMVAAEMRSQGIILFGAQQQASKVSEKVIENSAIRVLGRTGSLELGAPVWKFLSPPARDRAQNLQISEKLVLQDNFREPMLLRIPFPAWAMNPNEAGPGGQQQEDASNASKDDIDDFIDT